MELLIKLKKNRKTFLKSKNHYIKALFNQILARIFFPTYSTKQMDKKKAFTVRVSDNLQLPGTGDNILPWMLREAHDRDEANNVFHAAVEMWI